VPVPPSLLDALDLMHCIRKRQGRGVRLWPWSRMTWRIVHRGDAGRRADRPARLPQGPAARFWGAGRQ
jgi:hypothetical protein